MKHGFCFLLSFSADEILQLRSRESTDRILFILLQGFWRLLVKHIMSNGVTRNCVTAYFSFVSFWCCVYFLFKVPLTPKMFFLLIKSTSFPDFISEKIILINKILALLQAFELVSSMFTTAQSGIWVGLLVTSLREPGWNTQETLTELRGLSKHFWVICDSYFIETEQDFSVKELYHLALQFGVYLRFGRLRCVLKCFFFSISKCGSPTEIVVL